MHSYRVLVRISGAALFLAAMLVGAPASPGDKAGWSVDTDPRKRAFLKYVSVDQGPRLLVLGCLRDVDSFIVLSQHDPGAVPPNVPVTLVLANGAAKYTAQGKSEANGIAVGERGFASEIDVTAKERAELQRNLLAVLEGSGPIALTVGSWSRVLPTAGLASVIGRFKAVCFE